MRQKLLSEDSVFYLFYQFAIFHGHKIRAFGATRQIEGTKDTGFRTQDLMQDIGKGHRTAGFFRNNFYFQLMVYCTLEK